MNHSLSPLAASLAAIAHEAGQLILKHYAAGAEARVKDDASPVTAADEEAEALILRRLAQVAPGIPIVAEEEVAAGRLPKSVGEKFFLVDPLDGTKEFIKRNGEFTVNIALIEKGRAVCGVVLAPAKDRMWIGDGANGAFELPAPQGAALNVQSAKPIRARQAPGDGLIAIASRTHRDSKTDEYLAAYKIADMVAAGSSLKFCLVATGEADLYPRLGRTMEWDTAAGQAVLEAAGGTVKQLEGAPFLYGKITDGFANPFFVARGRE
jgi:3'(2'), 5'-bisphosphate nucleotidase